MATLRATTAFHANDRFVADGEEVDSKDPIVKGREALFTTDGVEQATAAPGEKRARGVKKAAPKTDG